MPNVVIVRFDAPLFFANAHLLEKLTREVVADVAIPTPSTVILAAEPITAVDATAVDTAHRPRRLPVLEEAFASCSPR